MENPIMYDLAINIDILWCKNLLNAFELNIFNTFLRFNFLNGVQSIL